MAPSSSARRRRNITILQMLLLISLTYLKEQQRPGVLAATDQSADGTFTTTTAAEEQVPPFLPDAASFENQNVQAQPDESAENTPATLFSASAAKLEQSLTNNFGDLEEDSILSSPPPPTEHRPYSETTPDLEEAGAAELESLKNIGIVHGLQDSASSSPSCTDTPPPPELEEDPVLIVSLVDGTLAGISKATGSVLWKRRRGNESKSVQTVEQSASSSPSPSPLPTTTSSANPKEDATNISEAPQLRIFQPLVSTTTTVQNSGTSDWRTAAVPSMDGKVYLTARSSSRSGGSAATQELTVPTTARDLVASAPFVDGRGRVYTGRRQSTAVAIDGRTGDILRQSTEDQDSTTALQPPPPPEPESAAARNVVWLGRVDYTVSVLEPRSGQMDVEFSASEILSVNDMVHRPEPQQHSHPWDEPSTDLENSSFLPNRVIRETRPSMERSLADSPPVTAAVNAAALIATPNGHVALQNSETGCIEWVASEAFDTPVAFAVDSATGGSMSVHVVPDAVVPNGSSEYLSNEIQRQVNLATEEASIEQGAVDDDPILVGSLASGQLFAMPLGIKTRSHHRALSSQMHTVTASSATAAAVGPSSSKKVPQIASAGRHSASLHSSDGGSGGGRQHHHHGSARKHCAPGLPHFPTCLSTAGTFAHGSAGTLVSEMAPDLEATGVVPAYYHRFSDNDYSFLPHHHHHGLVPRRRPTMLRFLGSWLAPTIAFIFVVSFELGRRKRQHKQDTESELMGSDLVGVDRRNEDESVHVGLIYVNENVILGYGGHGTVVYKGTLEGRQVAVKRMLKAYEASSDREISLLIESDGHPNVVRYFLKEVRGDFVYLALELCDLSLHELIGVLRNHQDETEQENLKPHTVPTATKTVLHQITCGVRHLHHLRIVHRDLKPANILLADSRTADAKRTAGTDEDSPFLIYEYGDYVAKISDMGLGKQLMGQSSFGASTLADTSLMAKAKGGQSSFAGAGPGSVGWQAPEVMALRTSSDASVQSHGSSRAAEESAPDASPMDTASGIRTSRSVDIFSLGCIFYSTLVPGAHPFGEWWEREANIMHNRPDIDALTKFSPDAADLVASMIQRSPSARPTAQQVCDHPFFWQPDRRLAFLCDFSDRLEADCPTADGEDKRSTVAKLLAVERGAANIVGVAWDRDLDDELLNNVQRFRTYDPSSLRDLLRLIRNKHHHFDELPVKLKKAMDSNSDGFMAYFDARFPRLLIHCYNVCRNMLDSDDPLAVKYSITPIVRRRQSQLGTEPTLFADAVKVDVNAPVDLEEEGVNGTVPGSTRVLHGVAANETGDADTAHCSSDLSRSDRATGLDVTTEETESVDPHERSSDALPSNRVTGTPHTSDATQIEDTHSDNFIVWEGSEAATAFNCRGWSRSDDDWCRCTDLNLRKRDRNLVRCADDPKFRTRLCNHWDTSLGTSCPMRRKNKCIFAHGPVELRVKEAKRGRWGKLVDEHGDSNSGNPNHSGGEDTYGAARQVEDARKQEGKWNTGKAPQKKGGRRTVPGSGKKNVARA